MKANKNKPNPPKPKIKKKHQETNFSAKKRMVSLTDFCPYFRKGNRKYIQTKSQGPAITMRISDKHQVRGC